MGRRASSPAASEPELDIFDSLQPGQEDGVSGVRAEAQDVDFDNLLNDAQAAGDDGDEAFIALQQAASYRKASNLKGRTVKKGGGFQAMGMASSFPQPLQVFFFFCGDGVLTIRQNNRIECQFTKGHCSQGLLRSDANSKKDDSLTSRPERCRGHG